MKLRYLAALTCGTLCCGLLYADNVVQTNLVCDVASSSFCANPAQIDPTLIDAWGMSFSGGSPIWVSSRGGGISSLYNGVTGARNPTIFPTIPPGAPNGPTGQVSVPMGSTFTVPSNGGAAAFIFDTLGGTIVAWNGAAGNTPVAEATVAGARFEGLAIANNELFAANFVSGGGINVFNSSYVPVTVPGGFTDPNLPAGYAAFNAQTINGLIYVTYARVTAGVPVPTPGGGGFVDVYNTSGVLMQRLISNGQVDAPWGITLAPTTGFGSFSGDLLVGNFTNGQVNAFNPTTGAFLGNVTTLPAGLWALDFDQAGGTSSVPNALYFTDGPNMGTDGMLGYIQDTPEPATLGFSVLGIVTLIGYVGRRRAKLR